jgi:uncharacterized repeat protein (TIGR03843 family)
MHHTMSTPDLLKLMTSGDIESLGLLPWGSNYTFLVQICEPGTPRKPKRDDEDETEVDGLLAVYKPRRGEAPLWDFPTGTLYLREYAAYLVSEALGWRIVPPTVLRNGDQGIGSVQLFVDNDPNEHYFTFKDNPEARERLQQICLFDLITNNADRKSGHCIIDNARQVWAIDHGICFNEDYKLRTVIWEFASEPICEPLLTEIAALRDQVEPSRPLGKALGKLLDKGEVQAFGRRIDGLLRIKTFPGPNRYERSVPWPPV